MRAALFVVVFAVAATAQVAIAPPGTTNAVRVQFAPEKLPRYLEARGLYPWSVRLCVDSGARTVDPERVYMASTEIPVIAPARARAQLSTAAKRSHVAIAADLLTQGAALATGLTGFGAIAASTKVVGAVGVGAFVAGRLSQSLVTVAPDATPYLEGLLDAPVTLPPGGCATRVVYSGAMPRAALRKYEATIP